MPNMPHRYVPGLNADVSALGAGCWTMGGTAINGGVPIGWDGVDPDAAYVGLVRAHELGVSLFDTADVYGLGRSERLLGRLLTNVDRAAVVVSSKVGYFAGTARHGYEPAQMCHQFSLTLDNLGTDYLDIYYLHSADFGPDDRYLSGAVEYMAELKAAGLIRAVGMRAPHAFAQEWSAGHGPRAETAARFLRLFDAVRPDVVTARYNLLSPLYGDGETDIFAFAARHGVGVIVKQILGQGLLLKPDVLEQPVFSAADHRSRDPDFTEAALAGLSRRLAPLRTRFGMTAPDMARVALRYALQTVPGAPALVGFRNADQIHALITSLGEPLTADELAEIRTALHPTTEGKEPIS
jgi:1-deoxyxylulose-5-phosphate synthase